MALYAIGDLHLPGAANKTMDIFGSAWENHTEKLEKAFSQLNGGDVTVICGDLSWAMSLEEAGEDFMFIEKLPGRKIILKGNHDYWWETVSKMRAFFAANGIASIEILHNNCFFYGEDAAVCGTRGWFYEEEQGTAHDKKILNRELGRLETSLKAAGDRKKYAFLHYPPRHGSYVCEEILALLEKYNVLMCCSGHIHGRGLRAVRDGEYRGVVYKNVSADFVNFSLQKIIG